MTGRRDPRSGRTRRARGDGDATAAVVLAVAAMALAGLVVAVTRSTEGLAAVAAFLTAVAAVVRRMTRG